MQDHGLRSFFRQGTYFTKTFEAQIHCRIAASLIELLYLLFLPMRSLSSFDEHTKACIDVALVSFGPDVQVQQGFTAVSEMIPPTLTANGGTPMGAAIDKALDMIAEQKAKYNQYGTPYYRPWIFCITDGGPNDSYATAAQRLKEMEDATKVLGYCVGVANFDRHTMASIFNPERIFELDNLNFPALFKFVSSSLATVRNSDPNGGRSVAVEAPGDLHTINVAF